MTLLTKLVPIFPFLIPAASVAKLYFQILQGMPNWSRGTYIYIDDMLADLTELAFFRKISKIEGHTTDYYSGKADIHIPTLYTPDTLYTLLQDDLS